MSEEEKARQILGEIMTYYIRGKDQELGEKEQFSVINAERVKFLLDYIHSRGLMEDLKVHIGSFEELGEDLRSLSDIIDNISKFKSEQTARQLNTAEDVKPEPEPEPKTTETDTEVMEPIN